MTTKTISIERDTYEMLAKKRRGRETLSQVVRRLVTDCPALTVEELEEAMKPFIGIGAGRKARPHHKPQQRHAIA